MNKFTWIVTLFVMCVLAYGQTNENSNPMESFSFVTLQGKAHRWNDDLRCFMNDQDNECAPGQTLVSSYLQALIKPMRIGVIGADRDAQGRLIIKRPYLIIDGINLNTKSKTLETFKAEIEAFNLPAQKNQVGDIFGGLRSLGYTPILVQFAYTTEQTLLNNARSFAGLLSYFSDRKTGSGAMVWNDADLIGFQILGISQGGVIGRYGAYLYDQSRLSTQPPVRLFTTLDSPHQGAVVPRSVIAAVDFWGRERSKGDAKIFLDLLSSPGASELLIYDVLNPTQDFAPNTSSERWLFGEYRQATSYSGFPVVLLSNGKLDGQKNPGTGTVFQLNRWASHVDVGGTWGRAVNRANYSNLESDVFAFNREYNSGDDVDTKKERKGNTQWDLAQGSTYPFYRDIYDAFENAFYDEMKDSFKKKVYGVSFTFEGKWAEHEINTDHGTFIPTTSSLDLLCAGDLSVRKDCLFSQSSTGLNWESPGSRSTARAMYAVDPSHPGYGASSSGRHVTGATATVDLWRLFCEVAKSEWNSTTGTFYNLNLTGKFNPNALCMDQQAISPWFYDVVAPLSYVQSSLFPGATWAYNSNKTDLMFPVQFNIPTGWNTVATFDRGQSMRACDVIEVTTSTKSGFQSNWLNLELVLSTQKNGSGWWQLEEKSIPVDGQVHVVNWQLPCSEQALKDYRWVKLIMNSQGGRVEVQKVRILNSTMDAAPPQAIYNSWVVPLQNGVWGLGTWGDHNMNYTDELGNGIYLNMPAKDDGAYFSLPSYKDLSAYTQLNVTYWPGTCQNTWAFFDKRSRKYNAQTGSYTSNAVSLAGGTMSGSFIVKSIHLGSVIDQEITPLNTLSAQRLYLQSLSASETCIIKEIKFQ